RELRLGVPLEVAELDHLALGVGQLGEGAPYGVALEREPGLARDVGVVDGLRRVFERRSSAHLFTPHSVDGPMVRQREQPGRWSPGAGVEAARLPPDGEERLLDDVLGERRVARDAAGQGVGGRAVTVVERAQRVAVASRDESDQSLVREVLAAHSDGARWAV